MKTPAAELYKSAHHYLNLAVILLMITGLLLGISEPVKLYGREAFWVKMISLAIALLVTYFVFNPMVRRGAHGRCRAQRHRVHHGGMVDGGDGGKVDWIFLKERAISRSGEMNNNQIRIGASAALVLGLSMAAVVPAQQTGTSPANGEALFNARCKSCHEPAIERAPGRTELALRPREGIVTALTTGVMAPMAQGLSRPEIEAVALFLTPSQTAVPAGTDKMCSSNEPIQASATDWATLGLDENSTRFQPSPGLKAADVPRLKVKWAFSMTGGGQPIVVGDWLFITNRGGKFYALDAKSGCVHWAIDDASSRTTPMVIRSSISPSGWATFVGVGKRVVRAFDAQNGKELWHSESLENHVASGITGTPVVSGDQLFVPLSSGEEVVAMQPKLFVLHLPRQRGSARSEDRSEAVADLHDHRTAAAHARQRQRRANAGTRGRPGMGLADGRCQARPGLRGHRGQLHRRGHGWR